MKSLKWLVILLMPIVSLSEPPKTFGEAKKQGRILFGSHRETLYCQCKFDARLQVDLASCNMQLASNKPRAKRVEWEHMMPAENFGAHFPCWRKPLCAKKIGKTYKGRKCCEKVDKEFRQAEAELYNLWPAVGLVNQARSNFRYNLLKNHTRFYGCSITIENSLRRVEPADYAKGIVARANLFMSDKYNINLSEAERKLFNTWNKQFPPNDWEKQWGKAVKKIEGYANPYIFSKKAAPYSRKGCASSLSP